MFGLFEKKPAAGQDDWIAAVLKKTGKPVMVNASALTAIELTATRTNLYIGDKLYAITDEDIEFTDDPE